MVKISKKVVHVTSGLSKSTYTQYGVIYLVRTRKGGRGVAQKRTRGRGVDTSKYVPKKPLFARIFLYFHIQGTFDHTLLSLVTAFITVLQNTCCDQFPVSQIFYSLFLYGIIDWIFKNILVRNGGMGVRKVKYVHNKRGAVAHVHLPTMGEGGQIFVILVRTY